MQQLESARLVELVYTKEIESSDDEQQLYSGRKITAAGQKLLDEAARSCRDAANEICPRVSKVLRKWEFVYHVSKR